MTKVIRLSSDRVINGRLHVKGEVVPVEDNYTHDDNDAIVTNTPNEHIRREVERKEREHEKDKKKHDMKKKAVTDGEAEQD